MNTKLTLIFTSLTLCLALVLSDTPVAHAEQESFFSWMITLESRKGVKPVSDNLYNEECGSCHFAYQPGFLPAASWQKLLTRNALENHFDENAELGEKDRKHILTIAVDNSADKSRYKRSKKVMASLRDNEAPIRITKVRYLHDKHKEVYEKVVKNNQKIKSMSLCDECHQKAEQGIFDDDTVVIPDYGRWTW